MSDGGLIAYRGVMPRLAGDVFVAPGAWIIGDVEIGARSSVWFNVVIRGDVNFIRIGERTNIQDGTVIHVASDDQPTVIGSDVTVGHKAMLHACTLESGSFVGMNATVLDGAVVESGAMVAAGALVTAGKRVPRGELWAGAPARCLRRLSEDEQRGFFDVAEHYARLAADYLAGTGPRPAV